AATVRQTLQFDVALAPFCLNGAFPVVIAEGRKTVQATLTLAVGADGRPTGTLAAGAETFALTGTQSAKKGVLVVTLNGSIAGGATLKLVGRSKGLALKGAVLGTL